MRVSTAQFYQQSTLQMSQKTSDVNEQMAYLTSGKQVLTAKDDAVSYSTLAGYKDDLANIEKYKRNITQAESHNNLQDIVLSSAEDLLNNIKDKMLQANNGAMSDQDLEAIAKEARNSFDQMLDLANTQNENGDYIFSGFNIEQQPFSQQVDGTVVYSGDTGVNEIQIAKNITIATNQTGDAAFLNVANAMGDFTASYTNNTSGIALANANVTDRSTYNTSASPHTYTFTFDAANDLTVTDADGDVAFPAAPYNAGDTISFDGIDVTLSGNPLPGDSFTITEQEEVSIFDTINNAITWMESGTNSANPEQHQVDYNTLLDQFNSAMTHITSKRVDAGVRLQVLESQESRHLDMELNIASGTSAIEDLDFAKAISEFEQSQIALQASQQAFTKIQGLTLFNYI
jgi:flagellar hook-associated protein 3 FlgL